jgi:hypothetical protein
MRYAAIAGVLSFLFAVAVHLYDCQTGTHEQCLMSTGLFWVYWLVSFLLAWLVVGCIGATIEWFRGMTDVSEDRRYTLTRPPDDN